MTTDSEITKQYLTSVWSRFLITVLVFCVTWLRTWNGLSSVCKCFCNCNNIRQVAAAFPGVDRRMDFWVPYSTGLILLISYLLWATESNLDKPVYFMFLFLLCVLFWLFPTSIFMHSYHICSFVLFLCKNIFAISFLHTFLVSRF